MYTDALMHHSIIPSLITICIVVLLVSTRTSHNCVHVKVSMSGSPNQDYYFNADSRSSLEQSPVMKTEIAEPKATQCKTTVTESEFTKSKCTESMAAESKVVCSTSEDPMVTGIKKKIVRIHKITKNRAFLINLNVYIPFWLFVLKHEKNT